ncbi:MAG: glycosyltransferase family 39 protein [Planctomycetota bacterium]
MYAAGRIVGNWANYEEFLSLLVNSESGLAHAIARAYTAIAGTFLVWAVYRLGRQFFPRNVSLLAAAFAALSPVQVIYAHQARIHVPGIVILTIAAIVVFRCIRKPSMGSALAAGAACAVCASVIQFGLVLTAAAGAMAFLTIRPWSRFF